MGSCCAKQPKRKGTHEQQKKSKTRTKHLNYDDRKIIIIGAGVAGLACGVELKKLGFEHIRILEMSDRIGGRVRTMKFADSYVDVGAQWVYGKENNVVYEMVKALHALQPWDDMFKRIEWIRSNGEKLPSTLINDVLSIIAPMYQNLKVETVNPDVTFCEYLTEYFKNKLTVEDIQDVDEELAKEFLSFFMKMEGNLRDMNAALYGTYDTCVGPTFMSWREQGFKKFLQELCQGDDLNVHGILKDCIRLNHQVTQVNWDRTDRAVKVTCEDRHFNADHLVITVSLGVLKSKLIHFQPNLPKQKIKAINGLGFATVCKIFVEFEEKFWKDDWQGFNAIWREKDVQKIRHKWITDIYGFHVYAHQNRVLLAWAAGSFVELIETLDKQQLRDGIEHMLRLFLKDVKIPHPKQLLVSKWTTEVAHRGAYCYPSMMTQSLGTGPEKLAEPISIFVYDSQLHLSNQTRSIVTRPIILFAGEATSPNHYSTVHGAVETGIREAERLATYYNSR